MTTAEKNRRKLHRQFLYDYYYEGGAKRYSKTLAEKRKEEAKVAETPERKALREYLYSDEMLNEIVVIMPKHSK